MTLSIGDLQQSRPTVRILASERDECFTDMIAFLVHDLARIGVSLVVITPSTASEIDLLQKAAEVNWDVAFLILNNIAYASPDRTADTIERCSVKLVRTMVQLFRRPVIACYGYPDTASFPTSVLEAGATEVFRLPWEFEDVQQAIKRCLPIW